jgi:hypothetical protein
MCYSPVESLGSSMTSGPVLMDVLQFCVIYVFVLRMCYSPVKSMDSSMTLVPVLMDVLQFCVISVLYLECATAQWSLWSPGLHQDAGTSLGGGSFSFL